MNEELTIAIEELRQRPTDRVWFIPVKLNRCKIPNRNIGGGETLNDRQHVKLYKDWDGGIQRIIEVIQSESPEPVGNGNTNSKFSENFTDQDRANAEDSRSDSVQSRKLTDWVFKQGNFLLRHNQIDRAIEAYSHAIDLNPRHTESYNNRGGAYRGKKDPDKAIQDYTTAIKLSPRDANIYCNRGNAYATKGNFCQRHARLYHGDKTQPEQSPVSITVAVLLTTN